MTHPEPEDEHPFAWDEHVDDEEVQDPVPARDLKRVGLVVGTALVLLVGLFFLLAKILGGLIGDMWDSVFTF